MPRSFNGTSDVIHLSAACVTNGGVACTIAGWIKTTPAAFKMLYSESNPTNTRPLFFFSLSGSSPHTTGHQLEIEVASGSSVDVFQSSVDIATSTWRHVAFRQDASNNMELWADGAVDGTKTRTSFSNSTGQTLTQAFLGASRLSTLGNTYPGTLAHWATWTRHLSDAEMKALANGLLPSHLGPTHYWPLWGVDSPEADIGTGTHVTGTLTGTTQGTGGPPVALSLLGLAA